MKFSINLGRIAGIKILVHWTFFLLLGWIVFSELGKNKEMESILWTLGFVLTIFTCVVLHELGHSLTAKRYGIKTRTITLLPIGGLATLEKMPDEAKQELWITVMGPAVNLVIAALLYPVIKATTGFNMDDFGMDINAGNFLQYLYYVNVILVVFNMIPAFPMDGGRILRALLALRIDRVKATSIASGFGKFFAILFVLLGIYSGNLVLLLIGFFVFLGANAENTAVQYLSLMRGHLVKDAMMVNFTVLSPYDSLMHASDMLLAGSDHDFIVKDDQGNVIGILTRELLITGLRENPDEYVGKIMSKDYEYFGANDKLSNVYMKFQTKRKAFFPVLDDQRLVGVINSENLNEFILIQSAIHY